MPAIRKCAQCNKPTLISSMGIFKATRPYECSNCGAKVNISPLAMLGMQLTVLTSFSLAGLFWVIFIAGEGVKISTIIYVFLFWLFLSVIVIWVVIFKIRKNYQNPIVMNNEQPDSWIEGKSLSFGIIAPIVLIVIILVVIFLLQVLGIWM